MNDFEPREDAESAVATAPTPDPDTGLLVNPVELQSFGECQRLIAKAREQADRVPAEIGDDQAAGEVADALKAIRFAREDTERARKDEKRPYSETASRIEASFKEVLSPLTAIEEALKDRLVFWQTAKERAAEEERKREERNARERQKREDERAAKEGRASHHHAAPPPKKVTQGARGMAAKSSVKKVTRYEIVDEAKLPDRFVKRVPNRAQIKAAVEAGEAVPGTRVWQEQVVATR